MKKKIKDYYKTLGVSESATSEEIKIAFRQLAIQYHPDRNAGDPSCEEKFKEITEAYGALIDPTKRRKYDLFRSTRRSGANKGQSEFQYTQDDIFEEMFKNPKYSKIFEELNQEFSQSGFRSGPGFFQNTFFNGGSGWLLKLLWLLPGPLGRIGNIFRLIQMAGSAFFFLARIMNPKPETGNYEINNPILRRFHNLLKKEDSNTEVESKTDIKFFININPSEAKSGAQKDIAYTANEIAEKLAVRIPPGVKSGQTLRLKNKGRRHGSRRGDLLLQIKIQSEDATT